MLMSSTPSLKLKKTKGEYPMKESKFKLGQKVWVVFSRGKGYNYEVAPGIISIIHMAGPATATAVFYYDIGPNPPISDYLSSVLHPLIATGVMENNIFLTKKEASKKLRLERCRYHLEYVEEHISAQKTRVEYWQDKLMEAQSRLKEEQKSLTKLEKNFTGIKKKLEKMK